MDKSEARKVYKALRAAIKDKPLKSKAIHHALVNLDYFQHAENIAAYASFGSEVDTWELLKTQLHNKHIALPKVQGRSMEFYQINNLENMLQSSYGIWEPDISMNPLRKFDIVLLPGLAFDVYGHRMGYGGGYYDKYFSDKDCLLIGLCFEEQIQEQIPHEPHDIKMNMIITDKRIIHIAKNNKSVV